MTQPIVPSQQPDGAGTAEEDPRPDRVEPTQQKRRLGLYRGIWGDEPPEDRGNSEPSRGSDPDEASETEPQDGGASGWSVDPATETIVESMRALVGSLELQALGSLRKRIALLEERTLSALSALRGSEDERFEELLRRVERLTHAVEGLAGQGENDRAVIGKLAEGLDRVRADLGQLLDGVQAPAPAWKRSRWRADRRHREP